MLTGIARFLAVFAMLLFLLIGIPLFFFPGQMAPIFAWKVSTFVAMTIGAWCLGNAWLAGITALRGAPRLVFTAYLYLGFFGLFELGVLFAFREKLVLNSLFSWGYLAALCASLAAGLAGSIDWLRLGMGTDSSTPSSYSRVQRLSILAFVLFVGFLAAYGMLVPQGGVGTNGGIFPEVLSPFTLRSFGAFYLSLALAVIPFLFVRSLSPLLHHSFASYGLIVIITAAALANLALFDFVHRPGGLVYIGAYFVVGIPVGLALLRMGTGVPASAHKTHETAV